MPAPPPCAPLTAAFPGSPFEGGTPLADAEALPLAGLTVLLVEDSRFAADAMRLMCRKLGMRLRRAETLEQADAHLRTYRPDVVIVDLGLPDGRGEALLRRLSRDEEFGGVLLATSGDSVRRKNALAAGALGFYDKPLSSLAAFQELLLAAIASSVQMKKAATERAAPPARRPIGEEAPDPLAMRDDLLHVVRMIEGRLDKTQRKYIASFVAGIARMSDDDGLGDAARAAAQNAQGIALLRHVIGERLAQKTTL